MTNVDNEQVKSLDSHSDDELCSRRTTLSQRHFMAAYIVNWELNKFSLLPDDFSQSKPDQFTLDRLSAYLYSGSQTSVTNLETRHQAISKSLLFQSTCADTALTRNKVIKLLIKSVKLKNELVEVFSRLLSYTIKPNENCFQLGPNEWQEAIIEQVIEESRIELISNQRIKAIANNNEIRLLINQRLDDLSTEELLEKFNAIPDYK